MSENREHTKSDRDSRTQSSLDGTVERVFIDVTCTAIYGGNSGIQRVVRNIVNHHQRVSEKYKRECVPVMWTGNGFVGVQKIRFRKSSEVPITTKSVSYIRATLGIFNPLVKVCGFGLRAIEKLFVTRKKPMEPTCGSLVNITRNCMKAFRCSLRRYKLILKHYILYPELTLHRRVKMQPGDVLLLIDASWHLPLWREVDRAKANGAKIAFLLYDLIPINASQFYEPELVRHFSEWLTNAIESSDYCFVISNATEKEFRQYLEGHAATYHRSCQLKLESFRLGADLDLGMEEEDIRDKVRSVFDTFGRVRPYIVVSTIEPRKNHGYLLDAFELVWAAGIEANLCIIGKVGWLCEGIVGRIRTHPLWQKSLFMLNDVNDRELQFIYSHAKILICPSMYEGFGLPIVEALNRKLLVMASDIPAHREVGGNYCLYFDLESPENLAKLVLNLESEDLLPSHTSSEDFHWLTWEESCAELFEKIIVLTNEEVEAVSGLKK